MAALVDRHRSASRSDAAHGVDTETTSAGGNRVVLGGFTGSNGDLVIIDIYIYIYIYLHFFWIIIAYDTPEVVDVRSE